MKILLAEDDQRLGTLIHDYLLPESEIVDVVNTGLNIAEKIQENSYDILILDVMLPKKNGIDICRELRKNKVNIAILFITALSNQNDKIKAFESGADDYLIKPFDFEELLARVKALLRRDNKTKSSHLIWNDLVMIPEENKLYYDEHSFHLTPTEFKILQIFLTTPNKVFSPDSIIDRLWDIETTPTNSTLRTHIKSLRKKLEEKGLEKNFIETVYGVGYRLKPPKDKLLNKTKNDSSSNTKKNTKKIQESKEDELKNLMKNMWLDSQQSIADECQKLSDYIEGKNQELDLDQAIRIAHNFVGSLGSLGFETASHISKDIENLLKNNRDHLDNQEIKSTIINLLNDLETNLFPSGKITTSENQQNSSKDLFFQKDIQILVIDEDIKLSNNLILFMDNPQVHFDFVYSIKSGLQYLKERQYDLVILETEWKKKSTNQLVKILDYLKKIDAQTNTIIYTQNDSLENRLYCSKYPISAFLNKSNSLEILWENIKTVLSNNHISETNYLYDILIIDDDVIFTEVLKQKLIFNKLPVNIQTISDSQTFLEEIAKIKPELIILDLQMPKLNGLDICKIIKKDPFLQSIPIIFLTGHLAPDIINQFVEAGADDFISKSKIDLELYPRIMTNLKRFNSAQ
jgi:DNA-binding response OmpR family regulator/HPt (histidine-containing phosphotransfer) domain-containing protein